MKMDLRNVNVGSLVHGVVLQSPTILKIISTYIFIILRLATLLFSLVRKSTD